MAAPVVGAATGGRQQEEVRTIRQRMGWSWARAGETEDWAFTLVLGAQVAEEEVPLPLFRQRFQSQEPFLLWEFLAGMASAAAQIRHRVVVVVAPAVASRSRRLR